MCCRLQWNSYLACREVSIDGFNYRRTQNSTRAAGEGKKLDYSSENSLAMEIPVVSIVW